ncbi:MAG TPA: sodium:solute symporter family protein [bacterium]|nr:sodium:solute symporter family protein [bacterium]HPN43507.1 sodium:solute symporter family protein [bacterium]
MLFGFNIWDMLVIIAYFLFITIWGLWIARSIKTSDSYFRGERKFKWWIMMGQAFGTGTHAENFVAQTGATYQLGFSTIWYQWKNMLITPFYWLIAPWYRRSERTTIGEMVEDRYSPQLGVIYTVFAIAYFIFNQGVMLQGAAKVISIVCGHQVSSTGIIIAMSAAFIIYSFFGGLVTSAYLNFLQALMIIVLSMMLIPSGLIQVGGFHGMRESLSPDFFRLFSEQSGMGLFMILMLAVNGIVGITAQPHILSMCATGNTERAGRVGQTYGAFVKRLCTIGWALTGIIVAAMLIQRGETLPDPEMAFGYATRELLAPGLVGLMIASILAANMSSCSTFMVNAGALFTRNLYELYIKKNASEKDILRMGRLSGFVLAILGVLFALTVKNVLHAFLFTETIAAFMGIMIFGGILWKRANRYGALAAVISSFGLYYLLNYLQSGQLMLVYKWTPAPFGWAMLAGFTTLIIVSLLTKAEDPQRIDRFFDNMNRLSDTGVAIKEKPLAKDHGKDLILLDVTGWFSKKRWQGFRKRYREDIVGFFLAWGMVGLLVLLAWGIMQF